MRKPCVSIDLMLNFIRPIRPGESVVIRAELKIKEKKLLQLPAEAHNDGNKLIATATSNLMVYDPPETTGLNRKPALKSKAGFLFRFKALIFQEVRYIFPISFIHLGYLFFATSSGTVPEIIILSSPGFARVPR